MPDRSNALLGGLRRFFWLGALGIAVVVIAMIALFVIDGQVQRSAAVSRDLIGIGRRAHFFSIERQSAVRGYVLSGREAHHAPDDRSAKRFAETIDSLVTGARYDAQSLARAHDLQRAIARWERAYARPAVDDALGGRSEAAHAIAGDQLFDAVRDAIATFIQGEERSYSTRLASHTAARRLWLGGLLVPLLLVVAAMFFYSRRLFALARGSIATQERLEEQSAELEEQAAQLEEHAVDLEEQNEESQRLATELAAANEGLMATLRDLDASRTAEAVAQSGHAKAEGLLNLLLDASPVGIGLFDTELRFAVVNDAMAEINQQPKRELLGRKTSELVDPDLAEDADAILRRVLETGEPVLNVALSGTILSDPATERHYVVNYFPVRDPGGEISGVGITVVDTTERKALEIRLAESQKMEAVGRLAGGIAHDFNNLLTVIRSYSELLLDEMDEWSQHRPDVGEINNAAVRAAELTQQLLAFSRQQLLRPQHLDVNAVIGNMEKMLRRLAGPGVTMEIALEPGVWRVKADPIEIERVIVNLVLNARDAMPDGGTLAVETKNVELSAAYARQNPEASAGPHTLLCVSDTGMGMTRDVREKLFEPFFTTKKRAEGAGMGLSSIYGIVRQSGGHISVSTEPGQGTRFEVYLPRNESPDAEAGKPAMTRARRSGAVILLVEDDDMVRAVTRRILLKAGYEVEEAVNGREALDKCRGRDNDVDLVLTDIEMPEMNGAELADRLATLCPGVRILFISGYTEDRVTREKLIQPGAPFLEKPFTPAVLLDRVREVLGVSAGV